MFTKITRAEERPRRNRFIEHSVPLIRMVLVELIHNCQTKNRLHARATVCDNRFFLSYCLRFKKLNVSSRAAIEILEKFFECLETRYSILEPRTSMLDPR